MADGLFAIDVLAQLHGHERGHGVLLNVALGDAPRTGLKLRLTAACDLRVRVTEDDDRAAPGVLVTAGGSIQGCTASRWLPS